MNDTTHIETETPQRSGEAGRLLGAAPCSPSNDSTHKKKELYELALFAGAGGGILGGKLLGWRTVCAVEINEYARRVLMARQDDGCLPAFPIWDDVTTFDGKPWRGLVDVISGGFPCQDISSAGNGKGLDGERSGLWRDMARIVREVRPCYVLVENSPLLVGRGLATVLCDFAGMGYDAVWGVLGAHHAGAPHRRERAWLVAYPAMHGGGNETTRTNPGAFGRNALARLGLVRGSLGCGTDSQPGMAWNGSTWRDNGGRDAKPPILGVADGMANRVDRCHAIGNGQVPAVVRMAWHTLGVTEMENPISSAMNAAPTTPALANDAQRGSHWQQRMVGRHGLTATLYHADCLAVLPLACDAVVTDPPYGTTACKWDDTLDLPMLWERLKASVKTRGAVVMTASQPFTAALVMSNLEWFKYCWVWEKSKASNFLWADYMPLKAHEDIAVFSEGPVAYTPAGKQMAYYPQKMAGKAYDKGVEKRLRGPSVFSGGWSESGAVKLLNESGDRNPRSVIYFRTAESEGNLHPTQKPVALMAYLVATYAQPGETVLDPYMGSGTTGIAALRKGCNFIGIERDAAHYKTACDRIAHELDGALL